ARQIQFAAAGQSKVGRVAVGRDRGRAAESSAAENSQHFARRQGTVVDTNEVHGAGRYFVGKYEVVDEEMNKVSDGREHRIVGDVDEADLLHAVDVPHKLAGCGVAGNEQMGVHAG